MFTTTGSDSKRAPVTGHDDGHLEQNSPVADSSTVGDNHPVMDRRTDQQYSRMSAHPLTPGVRYVTPVGSSLQTPYDGRTAPSQHYSHMMYSQNQNFHSRDAGHFRLPSHIFNPMSGAHTMPEATPFQAIVNPLENGHHVTHSGMSAPRPCSWHVSPSRSQHGGLGDVGVGKTPSFRRTPGARRSSRLPDSCQPALVSRPLFQPSSCVRTRQSCGSHPSNVTLPPRAFSENDLLRRAQSVSTGSSYPAAVKSRSSTEPPSQFDASINSAGGVELVVSNLDYNISSHEWKKILTCELQQQVQVYL